MIVPCVVLLSLDEKTVSEDSDLSEEEMVKYGSLAIMIAVIAPLFWTLKIYYVRKIVVEKCFIINDLAMD